LCREKGLAVPHVDQDASRSNIALQYLMT